MGRVVHFEIHADDPERAIQFYSKLHGWSFSRWPGPWDYWTIMTGPDAQPGINGGLIRRQGPGPVAGQAVNSYVCTVDVRGIDAQIQKAGDLGAETAVPKMAIPGVGWLVYLKDTEGNIFGMMETDPAAGLPTGDSAG
jgi:predicted enzyme related to lactoylglutathione lyase